MSFLKTETTYQTPGVTEHLRRVEEENRQASEKTLETIAASQREIVIIQDIDEVLYETTRAHYDVMTQAAIARGADPRQLPTYEEMCLKGGSDYFKGFFGDVDDEEWQRLAEVARCYGPSNGQAPLMEEGVREKMRIVLAQEGVTLGCYLTATPGRLDVRSVRQNAMFASGNFSEAPMIMRPIETPIQETGTWKMQYLLEFATAALPGDNIIILIDDSLSTAKLVQEKNIQRINEGLPPIIQIVYPGPITKPKLDKLASVLSEDNGIYIAHNGWDQIPEIIERIKNKFLNK